MVSVISKTEPTKLVSALRASHVHTTLILLNLYLALGAVLCVEFNPNISIIVAHLNSVIPLRQKETVNRSVSFL